jgi:hypothetical protein
VVAILVAGDTVRIPQLRHLTDCPDELEVTA